MTDEDDAPDPWAAPAKLGLNNFRQWQVGPARVVRRKSYNAMRTHGCLPPGKPAFVYVGSAARKVKVGMSTNVTARAKNLGISLIAVLGVVPEAARDVESATLTKLGASNLRRTEWVLCTPEEAEAALRAAWHEVSRRRHVDPSLTPDEARAMRLALASSSRLG